jgi:hypothetical protein
VIMLGMKLTAVLSLFYALLCAEDAQKPACNARTLGQFWPPEANADRDANRRLAQQGELQICRYGILRYGWKAMSVNVRELSRERNTDSANRPPEKNGARTRPGN